MHEQPPQFTLLGVDTQLEEIIYAEINFCVVHWYYTHCIYLALKNTKLQYTSSVLSVFVASSIIFSSMAIPYMMSMYVKSCK